MDVDLRDKAWKDLREFMEVDADIEVSMGFDTRVMAYFIRFEKWVPGKVAYFRFRWSAMVCLEEAILGGLLRWHVEYEREVAKYGKV